MTQIKTLTFCAAALAVLAATQAVDAQPRHRHHGRYSADSAAGYGYGPDDAPGAIIARRTAQAQTEPGLTNELAPDSRQTATGGPVGGVPGFDGY